MKVSKKQKYTMENMERHDKLYNYIIYNIYIHTYMFILYIDAFCSFFTLQTWSKKNKKNCTLSACISLGAKRKALHLSVQAKDGLPGRPWWSLKSPLRIGLWETRSIHGRTLWLINGGDVTNYLHPLGAHPPSKRTPLTQNCFLADRKGHVDMVQTVVGHAL